MAYSPGWVGEARVTPAAGSCGGHVDSGEVEQYTLGTRTLNREQCLRGTGCTGVTWEGREKGSVEWP